MMFAQRRNRLTSHFSEHIPVVKRSISVRRTLCLSLDVPNQSDFNVFVLRNSRLALFFGTTYTFTTKLHYTFRFFYDSLLCTKFCRKLCTAQLRCECFFFLLRRISKNSSYIRRERTEQIQLAKYLITERLIPENLCLQFVPYYVG
jgi:hypothetical protein